MRFAIRALQDLRLPENNGVHISIAHGLCKLRQKADINRQWQASAFIVGFRQLLRQRLINPASAAAMPLFTHGLPQKYQHGSQLGGHFVLRGIARMAAGFGGVEAAVHADFA